MIKKSLNLLSSILRTDVHYLAKGGFFLALTQVSSALIGFGLTIAFANLVGPETYGTYRYVLSVYALLAIFSLPGVDTAVLQSISSGFDSSLTKGFWMKLRFGVMGTIASFLFAGWNYLYGDITSVIIFIIVGIAIPFMEAPGVIVSFWNGKKLYQQWALFDIGVQIFSAGSLAVTIFLTDNIFFILVAYFIPYITTRLGAFYVLSKGVGGMEDQGLFSYAKSVTFFQVLTRVTTSIDQIVLFHFLGPIQVAIFSLAQTIPSRIQSFLRIGGTIAFPKFATRSASEITSTLPRKLFIFGLIILTGSILYVIVAPLIFKFLFPKYISSIAYSQVLIFYTLSAITYPFGSYLFAHKKLKENYFLASAGILSKIVSLVIFVPRVGIWGAVISVVASSLAVIIISFYFLLTEKKKSTPRTNTDNEIVNQQSPEFEP